MPRNFYISQPKPPDTSAIDRINELSKMARTSWFGLLAYLAFAGVTLLGVQDADFFIDSRQTALPLIGVEIPTRDFFVFGPILGTALFVYLHLYLLKLWEALAAAPPRPNGEALSLQVTPWLINDLGLALRRDGAFRRRPMDWLSHLVTFLLVFAIGPIVTGYFWVRYWPAHELGFSIFNALLFTLTTVTMLSSLFTAVTRLRYGMRYRGGWWHLLALVPTLLIALPTVALTIAKTDGPESLGPFRGMTEWAYARTYKVLVAVSPLPEPEPEPIGYEIVSDPYVLRIASADLSEVAFVSLPDDWLAHEVHQQQFRADWCARQGLNPEVCGPAISDDKPEPHHERAREKWCEKNRYVPHAKCVSYFGRLETRLAKAWKTERNAKLDALTNWFPRSKDLRNSNLTRAVMVAADLERVEMQGADLSMANLQGADLWLASLRGAVLFGADLQEANLGNADLQGADLSVTSMQGTDLSGADLQGAYLSFADLQGADLSSTNMQGASLLRANLQGAQLNNTDMRRADLTSTDMRGADLTSADMQGADLSTARMQGADLRRAHMPGTVWAGDIWSAPAHVADFRGSDSLMQDRLSSLIGDEYTLLPDTPDPATGQPLFIPSCWVEEPEGWSILAENLGRNGFSEDDVRADLLCKPGARPRKTGTPWPVDQPPPWESDPNWQPEDRGPVDPDAPGSN
ncbi:MAG: pentapeptide repeat-containing protein [Paracoccaceae bacterium]